MISRPGAGATLDVPRCRRLVATPHPMHAPPIQKNAPGFAENERQAQRGVGSSRDRLTGSTTTQAEPTGFVALVAEFERRTGFAPFADSDPEFAALAREIGDNIAGGRCVLCGGRGGDRVNPPDACPLCGKERGQ